MVEEQFTSSRVELEKVLVRQFKLLKDVVVLTKKERESLMNEPELVLRAVEDKEVLLDQMSLSKAANAVAEMLGVAKGRAYDVGLGLKKTAGN